MTAQDIIFQHFLGFPGVIPDFTTVWLFRERMIDNEVQQWSELNKQMERMGLKVRKGVI